MSSGAADNSLVRRQDGREHDEAVHHVVGCFGVEDLSCFLRRESVAAGLKTSKGPIAVAHGCEGLGARTWHLWLVNLARMMPRKGETSSCDETSERESISRPCSIYNR